MCGRYSFTSAEAQIVKRFRIAHLQAADLRPRYNIVPSQPAPVVVLDGDRTLDLFKWGLIPSWAKDQKIGYQMINARYGFGSPQLRWQGQW